MKGQWSRTDILSRKQERNTNTKNGIKYNTTQAESQENSYFPADGRHVILTKAKRRLFPSRWPTIYPYQTEEDGSFPADGRHVIVTKAKRTAISQQMTAILSSQRRGHVFASRWPPRYPNQSQEDSYFPADGRHVILTKAKRTSISQQMPDNLSLPNRRGRLFPSRWPLRYPNQSQEDSSFPAYGRHVILTKAKRTAISQQTTAILS